MVSKLLKKATQTFFSDVEATTLEDMDDKQDNLEMPKFESAIPEHLLGPGFSNLNAHEKYTIETLSQINAKTDWLATNLQQVYKTTQNTRRGTKYLLKWKSRITIMWGCAYAAVILCSVVLLLQAGVDLKRLLSLFSN